MTTWHVYLIRARDDSLYTGIATDVERRLAEHGEASPKGAKSLRGRGPLTLAFRSPVGDRALALQVEHRVKRLSKPEKERLVRDAPGPGELLSRLGLA